MKTIKFCSLDSYDSYYQAIKETLSASTNQLKKNGIKKNTSSVKSRGEVEVPIDLVNHLGINPRYTGALPRILSDERFLVLVKPEKIHTHPLSYSESDNILSYLRSMGYQAVIQTNIENYDRGILYRLDYETSGILVCAKSLEDYEFVRDNFKSLVKEKIYLAIVEGCIKDSISFENHITASSHKGQKMIVTDGPVNARIDIEPLEARDNQSLIKIKLHEGHRHQIRCQLAANGHSIIGDKLYSGPEGKRLYLHCLSYQLEIEGKEYAFFDEKGESLFFDFFNLNGEL